MPRVLIAAAGGRVARRVATALCARAEPPRAMVRDATKVDRQSRCTAAVGDGGKGVDRLTNTKELVNASTRLLSGKWPNERCWQRVARVAGPTPRHRSI